MTLERAEQRRMDRELRRRIARLDGGERPSLENALRVCPYRTLLGPIGAEFGPETEPTAIATLLGSQLDDFSAKMRADILGEINRGGVVLLLSNDAELRDHAKWEVLLALSAPVGTA